jgi:hypothetical protein
MYTNISHGTKLYNVFNILFNIKCIHDFCIIQNFNLAVACRTIIISDWMKFKIFQSQKPHVRW